MTITIFCVCILIISLINSRNAVRRVLHDSPRAADDRREGNGSCPYCGAKTNDFISINQSVEYSGIEIAINRQGMLRVRVYEYGQETFTAQDIVEIKCCPKLRRKDESITKQSKRATARPIRVAPYS